MELHIVDLDDSLIVIDKPPGLLSVPGRDVENQTNLFDQIRQRFSDALVVHRLDRDTSGLLVMARTLETQRHLARQFEQRAVFKRYVALIAGVPQAGFGRIELPIAKDLERPPRHRVDFARGRPAVTDWRIVARYDDRTRVELVPLTGRSHQLRLHLAEIGHPVLGDPLYGDQTWSMADRLMLHANRLSITHPTSGERMTWTSDCPF